MVQERPLTHLTCQPDVNQTEHVFTITVHPCFCEHSQLSSTSPSKHQWTNWLRPWKSRVVLLLCFVMFAVCVTVIAYMLFQTDIFKNERNSSPSTSSPPRQQRARAPLSIFPVTISSTRRQTTTSYKSEERECRNGDKRLYLSNGKFACIFIIPHTQSAADARKQCLLKGVEQNANRLIGMNLILDYYQFIYEDIKTVGRNPYLVLRCNVNKEYLQQTYCQSVRNEYRNLQPKEDACFVASANNRGHVCLNSEPTDCNRQRPAFCLYDP